MLFILSLHYEKVYTYEKQILILLLRHSVEYANKYVTLRVKSDDMIRVENWKQSNNTLK